jgi:glycine cleavage system aminomethyltransferase T
VARGGLPSSLSWLEFVFVRVSFKPVAFAVHPSKRRSKDFPGARLILDQLKGRGLKRKRVGLIGSGSMEAGDMIYGLSGHHLIGEVTSGLFSPHFEANIAMVYIHLGTLQPDWAVHVTNGMALTVRSRVD